VDLPIENGDFPLIFVCLPEATPLVFGNKTWMYLDIYDILQ
jgi:hypothetical protein